MPDAILEACGKQLNIGGLNKLWGSARGSVPLSFVSAELDSPPHGSQHETAGDLDWAALIGNFATLVARVIDSD